MCEYECVYMYVCIYIYMHVYIYMLEYIYVSIVTYRLSLGLRKQARNENNKKICIKLRECPKVR